MRVDIWSDVVCPWCYIGKRRFEAALTRFPHADQLEVTWRSFELDPHAPPSPEHSGPYVDHLARKYGISSDKAQAMIDRVTSAAAEEGLNFRFDIARRGNTFDAHRLLHLGLERGVQNQLKERLDHGTFTEGLPVSDHQALTDVAVDIGLDEVEVKEVLATDAYADAVRADEAQARAYGISAVPFFVIGGKYGMAGAQPVETMLEVLERAWSELSPITVIADRADSDVCEDGSCAV
ncbi:MAG TPA: DsbA family oxidoreductase [Actinomycetota bacterium]|nr:DsbA family oxidoreductase [Actinomycetota bacterium]